MSTDLSVPDPAAGIGRPYLVSETRASVMQIDSSECVHSPAFRRSVSSQPLAHWHEVFDHAHIPVRSSSKTPSDVSMPAFYGERHAFPLEGAAVT